MDIQAELLSMCDMAYKNFHKKLIPNIHEDNIIGIRTPQLRAYASHISKSNEASQFVNSLPHKYYEENNLHAFLIEKISDYENALAKTEEFLPYINNWATCDSFLPKIFSKHRDKLIDKIYEWLKSEHEYTVRYAIGLLMKLYLDECFKPSYAEAVAKIKTDKYYIKMMQAWYFATALAKQYDTAIKYFENKKLDKQTRNKAIQKAVESRRISAKTKQYLKTLKIKEM